MQLRCLGHKTLVPPAVARARPPLGPWLVAVLFAAAGCDERSKAGAQADSAAQPKAASQPTKGERRAELLTAAAAEAKDGHVEAAIAKYFDADRLDTLKGDDARAFASVLKTNGDAVVAKGEEVPRGMANYAKAISVSPDVEGLVAGLVGGATKQDAAGGLYSEDVVQSYIDDESSDLPAQARPVFAEFFRTNAERLMGQDWTIIRVATNLDRATALAPQLATLGETRKRATERGIKELAAAREIKATYDKLFVKDPSKDTYELVAKQHKMTEEDVMAAIEVAAVEEQAESEKRAAKLKAECGRKPSCGGLDGGCQRDESVFKNAVEVSNCTKPRLVEGRCWVVRCDVTNERTGRPAGQYELTYKAVQGVPMPVTAVLVSG